MQIGAAGGYHVHHDEANLCLSCRACNLRKSDRLTFPDDVTQKECPCSILVGNAGRTISRSISTPPGSMARQACR